MQKTILILGAHGQIAQLAEQEFIEQSEYQLKLFLRSASRMEINYPKRETLIEGDSTNLAEVKAAMKGVDAVYANLGGDSIVEQAKVVVEAMQATGVKRLVWISSLGIYDEVPGKFGIWLKGQIGEYLKRYREAADIIEASDLDYTIIRPAALTDKDEIDFEITQKNEPFKGTEVSRKSIAHVVVEVIKNYTEVKKSIGVNKPGTDGDKPAWY